MFLVRQPPVGQGLHNHEVSRSHTTTHHSRYDSSGRLLISSQRPLSDNTQHSQQTNIHPLGGIRTHDLSRRALERAATVTGTTITTTTTTTTTATTTTNNNNYYYYNTNNADLVITEINFYFHLNEKTFSVCERLTANVEGRSSINFVIQFNSIQFISIQCLFIYTTTSWPKATHRRSKKQKNTQNQKTET